jgi:integrase/recombinase XerD
MTPTIYLSEMVHRDRPCIAIRFSYHSEVKEHVKSFFGVQWSRTHSCFYVVWNHDLFDLLYDHLRSPGFTVDCGTLRSVKNDELITATPKATSYLSEENKKLLQQYRAYLVGLRLSKSTVSVYTNFMCNLAETLGADSLRGLTHDRIRTFIEAKVRSRELFSISSHRQFVSALKHLVPCLSIEEIDTESLIRPKKSQYLPTVLSQEEMVDLLRVTRNLKHRATLALLYSCGLRVSEVIELELYNIDIDRRQLVVRMAKGRKDRVVILAESFIPLLRNYIMSYAPQRYFIENPSGGKYAAGSIRNFLRRSAKAAGITKRVTPHTLRHSYATHLIEMGVGLRHVQDLLGHAKPETTMIYTHVAKKDLLSIKSPLDAAVDRLSAPDKLPLKHAFSANISG